MANILDTISRFLEEALGNEPPKPQILEDTTVQLGNLKQVSTDASGAGIVQWLNEFKTIVTSRELRETLLVRAMQIHFPRLGEVLALLGVVNVEWQGKKPRHFTIDWNKLNQLLTDPGNQALALLFQRVNNLDDLKALQVLGLMLVCAPGELLGLEYRRQGFLSLPLGSPPGVNSNELLELINNLIKSPLSIPLPVSPSLDLTQFKTTASATASGGNGSITIDASASPLSLILSLNLTSPSQSIHKTIDLGQGWNVDVTLSDSASAHHQITLTSAGIQSSNLTNSGNLSILLSKSSMNDSLLLGNTAGTHFSIGAVKLELRLHKPPPLFDLLLKLQQIQFALKPDFLSNLSFGLKLPNVLQFESDVEASYVQGKGLTGQGGGTPSPALGIQFVKPLNHTIGGGATRLSIDHVTTRVEVAPNVEGFSFDVLFRCAAAAQLGPLKAIIDGAGISLGHPIRDNNGLLLPTGIGISLDAPPVVGGGFLNVISSNEFSGALQLKILGIGAYAYGIYKSLPSGAPSFAALIGVRLPLPGIQLGFGFSVSGFGGLVGINRRADTDVLRERLTSGASGDVLFNDNPLRNAPKLLGDMQQFFPEEEGIFLIGPTLQINWLSILKLDAGIFIELPGPRKLFIAGSARLVLGSEEFALVYLRMDFLGGVDLTKSLIFFDAALVNSHVLGIFRITGGVALRINYGVGGYFLFTVGGFHPSFNPGAMELPRVARVGVSASLSVVWLKKEMYLAITSNTFQLGTRTEAGIEIGPIAAHGWFAFDALIQFQPFYFVAHIDAGFEVEVAGLSLCSVRVEGQLSGPGPLVLSARATVSLLFLDVSGDVTVTLSDNPPENVVVIDNLPNHLAKELTSSDNLRIDGDDPSVIFRPLMDGSRKLLPPVGDLIWEQKRVPLNLSIQKAEGVQLKTWTKLTLSWSINANTNLVPLEDPTTSGSSTKATAEQDWFGVGTYLKLKDGEALNNNRFDLQTSGLRIDTTKMLNGVQGDAELKIKLLKLPKPNPLLALVLIEQYVPASLAQLLHEQAHGARMPDISAAVKVNQETWNHIPHQVDAPIDPDSSSSGLNQTQAFVRSQQLGGFAMASTDQALDLTGVFQS